MLVAVKGPAKEQAYARTQTACATSRSARGSEPHRVGTDHLTVSLMEIYRLASGKIDEQWVTMDALGIMQQLGVIPAQE